ncbi:monofunctional biosynthetic peptidoglycan transglycosylase [Aquimarina sp. 2201CG14-23]|uniref:monofunctional biosynthetic peptidoglycan transglycosylase n=1 Tax=Aquimarina mycalae TaxID=3040073 RepID=UPI002477E2C5|nr:monofunctional biosynthetic peptidoglycan transglycosylase [Aquimarina sp. 2201CG14-23]MDH7446197.1 monofunctional biosynthetic peptidoglycan transglycosylase [Aquimarina sp. 2201CG14-23]
MRKIFGFIVKSFIAFIILSVLWVLVYKWVDVPGTPLMIIRDFQSEKKIQTKHQWVSIARISKNVQLAIICSEDQRFLNHGGFDTKAIQKAIKDHKSGKRLRGASTISQQTAKNVFLWPHRSWVRKGLESYFTFLIETFWSKERILEVYLNSIEMGDEIYGIEAAAQFWFNKSAIDLNTSEAAAIAAILPNPRKHLANPPSNYIQERKKWILQQMQNYGSFSL